MVETHRTVVALLVAGFSLAASGDPVLDRISADSLRGHVSFLASDLLEGRATPSRGLDVAAQYVAAQFARAGLEPAGNDGYFQSADFVLTKPNMEGFELFFESGGKSVRVAAEKASIENRAAVRLTGAKVFKLAPGDSRNLSADELTGKVTIVMPSVSRENRELVVRAKPAAVILVRSHSESAEPHLRDASEPVVPWIFVNDEAVRKFLDSLPEGDGPTTATLRIAAACEEPVMLRNVAGLLRGSDPVLRDSYVILSAHYDHVGICGGCEYGDHIFNGANDNASGTASVLEIASAMAASQPHPKRSILFLAFFGEERGMLGSTYYTRHPIVPLADTVADLNLEQLGRTDDSEGLQFHHANVTGFDLSDIGDILRKAGEATGVEVTARPNLSDQFFSASDNRAFAAVGIPSHTISVSYEFPDYHKVGDEWQLLDYDNMAHIDRMVAEGLLMIADNPTPPKWNAANPKAQPYREKRVEK